MIFFGKTHKNIKNDLSFLQSPSFLLYRPWTWTQVTMETRFIWPVFVRWYSTFWNVSAANVSHIGRVCTTWGHHHYKTFDGQFFQLPSTCNHVLVSQCRGSYEGFIVSLRRSSFSTSISSISMMLDGLVLEISNSSVMVNEETWVQLRTRSSSQLGSVQNQVLVILCFINSKTNKVVDLASLCPCRVSLPHVAFGVTIKQTTSAIFVEAGLGIKAVWNLDDSFDVRSSRQHIVWLLVWILCHAGHDKHKTFQNDNDWTFVLSLNHPRSFRPAEWSSNFMRSFV